MGSLEEGLDISVCAVSKNLSDSAQQGDFLIHLKTAEIVKNTIKNDSKYFYKSLAFLVNAQTILQKWSDKVEGGKK